jgi:hypothetical protein
VVGEVVKLKRVDLTGVDLSEPFPDAVKQQPPLLLVVRRDSFPRSATTSLLVLDLAEPWRRSATQRAPERSTRLRHAPSG